MNKQQFLELTKQTYNQVYEAFEKYDPDEVEVDYGLDNLVIEFANKVKFVVNRQTPVFQLWLATKNKGFHFDYNEQQQAWICDKSGKKFNDILSEHVTSILKKKFSL